MKKFEEICDRIPQIQKHLNRMSNCHQDKKYHGENDVLSHTEMVFEESLRLSTGLPDEDRNTLLIASILHDIGKPYCTKEEDGDIRSHGHAKTGYHIALELLDQTNMDFNQKLQICNLVHCHGRPVFVFEKEDAEYEVIKMSMDVNVKLLHLLSLADNLGRICDDKDENLIHLEFFNEVISKLNLSSGIVYPFVSNIAKFNYLVKRTHHFSDNPFDDTKSVVYLMSGLPGVGKDYYIQHNLRHLPVVSLDAIRKELKIKPTAEQGLVIQTAKERAREFLRVGDDFIWNATNTSYQMRDGLIRLFNDYHAKINIIYLHKNLDDILLQNLKRKDAVAEGVIYKLYRRMEIPKNYEAHQINYIF